MAYSKFTVAGLEETFGVSVSVVENLVGEYTPVEPSALLRSILHERISIHSGVEFVVDRKRGLDGFCDFLIADSPQQLVIEAPVLCAIEAKEHNLKLGIGQCIATMIAARLFNEKAERPELVDQFECLIRELDRLIGILIGVLKQQ
jgi:hypothetical protein